MAKDPAFLFYSSDFLTGTMFLTHEQVGKYIRLLCAQHQMGALTEQHMLNICQTYDKDIWAKFTKQDDGTFVNERLRDETAKRKNFCESRRKNRNSKPKEKQSYEHTSTPKKPPMSSHMENENENENENRNRKGNVKRFVKPEPIEILEYMSDLNAGVNFQWMESKVRFEAQNFHDFYESKGWVIGKDKMKDWKATVRRWMNKNKQTNNTNTNEQRAADYYAKRQEPNHFSMFPKKN